MSLDELIEKIREFKEKEKINFEAQEDLAVAIMHLISLEEHFYFTYEKTKKEEYLDLIEKVRNIRKDAMTKIIKEPEGELWCCSKHILGAVYRFFEVGEKLFSEGKKDEAKSFYESAYELFNLFFGLKFNIIKIEDIKEIKEKNKLQQVIEKLIDCCNE